MPTLKPAFDTKVEGLSPSNGPSLQRHFNYDLKQMFYEKSDSGECYKSLAKWDLPFGAEEDMQEMILKQKLKDSSTESAWNVARRAYLWNRFADAIFTE